MTLPNTEKNSFRGNFFDAAIAFPAVICYNRGNGRSLRRASAPKGADPLLSAGQAPVLICGVMKW